MGVNCRGIVFFGWHFIPDFLKEKIQELSSLESNDFYNVEDENGDPICTTDRIGIHDIRIIELALENGRKLKLFILGHFLQDRYDEVIFGKILAMGETYRNVAYTPIPTIDPEEANLITLLFEKRQLGVQPGFYLTGSGYS